jgi:L-lactate dehydrogenase (cytochrome)
MSASPHDLTTKPKERGLSDETPALTLSSASTESGARDRAAGSAPPPTVARPENTVPRNMRRYLALRDFEPAARRRLPKMLYGFVSGAAETDAALRDNREAFEEYGFVPRVLNDVSGRNQTTTLFGKEYAAPFGIPPMGSAALCTYRGDIALARAAAVMNVPMILSAASLIKLEDVKREGPTAWYQAYLAGEPTRIEPLVDRVAAAGYDTFVVTADVPVPANRENNVRNGYQLPITITPQVAWDMIRHPRWLLGTWGRTLMNHGMPYFENMDATRGPPILSRNLMRNIGARDQLAWRHVELIRRRWKGKLVVKGLIAPQDARIARESGVDGIMVSNHGGRQLDCTISPLRVLPEIAAEANGMTVMLDGGVRRGTDVLKALALGAHFVFVGRPFLFAAAVGGEDGVRRALGILKEEVDRDMALLGVRSIAEITPDLVRRLGPEAPFGRNAL